MMPIAPPRYEKRYHLETAKMIMHAYKVDEFLPWIVYGPLGWGKSAYSIKVAALIYGNMKEYNFEAVKNYIVFHPKEFIKRCEEMDMDRRDPVLIWDDAGLWLHALDHQHPFTKSVAKYLNVARTDWGSLIFTTPWPAWIIKKVRGLPQCMMTKIMKDVDSQPSVIPGRRILYKKRIARTYRSWVAPDMKKTGVRTIHEDRFTAWLPDDFFDWYKPMRNRFAEVAKHMMARALKRAKMVEMKPEERTALAQLGVLPEFEEIDGGAPTT